MERTCPVCREGLGIVGNYFCFRCGAKLPQELTSADVRTYLKGHLTPPLFIVKEEFSKDILKLKTSYIVFILVIILLTASAMFLSRLNAITKKRSTPVKEVLVDERILKTDADLPLASFGNQSLSSLIPPDVDLYVEGFDISKFLSSFTNLPLSTSVPKTDLKLSDVETLLDRQYVIFSRIKDKNGSGRKRVWGFLSKAKNNEKLSVLAEATKESSFSARLVDDYLVVSNDSEVFEDVKRAKGKTILSFSLNSKYATAKNSVPSQGKLLILLLTESASEDLSELKKSPLYKSRFSEIVDAMVKRNKNSYVLN